MTIPGFSLVRKVEVQYRRLDPVPVGILGLDLASQPIDAHCSLRASPYASFFFPLAFCPSCVLHAQIQRDV